MSARLRRGELRYRQLRAPALLSAERLDMADGDAGESAAVLRLPIEDGALAGQADDIGDEPPARAQRVPQCRQQLGVADAAADEDCVGRIEPGDGLRRAAD